MFLSVYRWHGKMGRGNWHCAFVDKPHPCPETRGHTTHLGHVHAAVIDIQPGPISK